jgi:CheY-like chemotaxis protein
MLVQGFMKQRILIVDDDARLSGLVRVLLERLGGYSVQEENRSFAALAVAREFRPHLIILDVNMPGKDGGDVAAELMADPETAHIPVIFCTSLVSQREANSRSGIAFVSKPVVPAELIKTVRRLLPAAMAA